MTIIWNIIISLQFSTIFSIVNIKKLVLHNRKTIQNWISGSDMRAANYRALLVDIPPFVPAIPQERDSRR